MVELISMIGGTTHGHKAGDETKGACKPLVTNVCCFSALPGCPFYSFSFVLVPALQHFFPQEAGGWGFCCILMGSVRPAGILPLSGTPGRKRCLFIVFLGDIKSLYAMNQVGSRSQRLCRGFVKALATA